jgi:hypothetical protein
MKNKIINLTLAASAASALVLTSGCVHILNQPQGKALSVTERGLGLQISYAPQSQSPEVKLGFFSSAVVILPTQTNGTVNTPIYVWERGLQPASTRVCKATLKRHKCRAPA